MKQCLSISTGLQKDVQGMQGMLFASSLNNVEYIKQSVVEFHSILHLPFKDELTKVTELGFFLEKYNL